MPSIQMNHVGKKLAAELPQQTGDVVIKSKDATPPVAPQVLRAFCFDHITDPSTSVVPTPPPPQPNPAPRRDPFLLELGNIELGSKVQIISLSDNPSANFDGGEVFELQFTGYDTNARRGTVLLSAEEMAKKAIEPGERLVVRVVDDNGNASDGVFVHVDPSRWANNGQLDTKNAEGAAIRVTGAPVQFTDGFVSPGEAVAGKTKSTFGATLTDTRAPKLLAENVAVKTFEWSKSEQEMFQSLSGNQGYFNNTTAQAGADWCKNEANLAALPIEYRGTVAEMGKDGGKLLQKAMDSLFPELSPSDRAKQVFTPQIFAQLAQKAAAAVQAGGKETVIVLNRALEPGTTINVQNNSTGQTAAATQTEQQRASVIRLNLREGDKITMQFNDGNGVRGEPYAFEYDASSKNGKRAEQGASFKNPLNFMLAARTVKLNGET